MRRGLLRFDRWLGALESAVLAALVALITAVTFAQVFARYVLSSPLIWSEELARYLFVWIVLIGAAAAVRLNEHFGLDLLRRHAPPALRTAIGALSMLVVALCLAGLLVTGIMETRQAAGQISPGLQVGLHWAYAAMPVGAALGLFHLIARWVAVGVAAHPLDRVDPDTSSGSLPEGMPDDRPAP